MPKVVILGGGIGGFSAAQELAERGFTVEVYERQKIPGGKARSIPVAGTGTGGRPDLPGEHGFRFFPGFYKHLPDTMRRIPYKGQPGGVLGNLVQATQFELARVGASDPILVARFPRSLAEFKSAIVALLTADFGIPVCEALFFAERLIVWLTSCDERRLGQWEYVSWWDFIKADEMSEAYRLYLARGLTRSLVAMRAEIGSTRTVAGVLVQLLLDLITPGETLDRLLNGPTNDVWIEPWLAYLTPLGVSYNLEHEVKAIHVTNGKISGVDIEHAGVTRLVTGDQYVLAMPFEAVLPLLTADLMLGAPQLASLSKLDYAWMNGIQFYLKDDVPLVKGHTIYTNSPWALTSVSQRQFWREPLTDYGAGDVRGVISVDISDWDTPGVVYGKAAKELNDRAQVKEEVWTQMKRALNNPGHAELLDQNLVTWFLDPDIIMPNPSGTTNLEPLMINRVGSWNHRPEATTGIPNLFLAADYVRTYTDLATMEGANEAARRAVNGILHATGSSATPCELWPLEEPAIFDCFKRRDAIRYALGLPHCLHPDTDP